MDENLKQDLIKYLKYETHRLSISVGFWEHSVERWVKDRERDQKQRIIEGLDKIEQQTKRLNEGYRLISVNGKDVSVHGLTSLAFMDSVSQDYLAQPVQNILEEAVSTAEYLPVVEAKVTKLIGSDSNKSVRTIANEELAAQLIAGGAKESLDELHEIAAWIQEHPEDASAMNAAITALQNKLVGVDTTVAEYVTAAINALKIGDYAKAADLTALANRVSNLEAVGATKVEKSSTNGNIKINGVETVVYTLPSDVIHGAIATDTEVAEMLNDVIPLA